mgnify:CR=1 FL=1
MAAEFCRDSILSFITKQQDGFVTYCRNVSQLGENFRQKLQSIGSDERLQILQIRDNVGFWTILHHAANNSDAETVEMILECVSDEERYILLSARGGLKLGTHLGTK